jgi:hypothetical protein
MVVRPFCNNPLVATVSAICNEAIKFVTHKKEQIDTLAESRRNGRGKDNKRYLLASW